MQAYHAGGSHNLGEGFLAKTQSYIDKGIALYAESEHREQALKYGGHDPCVCANSMGALNQFIQGNLISAERYSQNALKLAKTIGHRPSVAHAYSYRAELSHLRGQAAEARESAERVLEIAEPFGMNQYSAWAMMLIGWSRALSGQAKNALAQVEDGLERARSIGVRYHLPHRIVLWAETLATAGYVDEAIIATDEALAVSKETGERWFVPEIIRLKAKLLCSAESRKVDETVNLLKQAMTLAENIGAKLWQLRVAMAMVHLKPDEEEAKVVLQSIFNEFTEGFDTSDLCSAKALLKELT